MSKFAAVIVAAAALTAAVGAQAAPALDIYGGLPTMDLPTISPDGSKVAYLITLASGEQRLTVETPAGRVQMQATLDGQKLRSMEWAGSDHLVLALSSTRRIGRTFPDKVELTVGQLLDVSKSQVRTIRTRDWDDVGLLLDMPKVRNVGGKPVILFKRVRDGDTGRLALMSMDPDTGRTALVDTGVRGTVDWTVDEAGRPIARVDYDERRKLWTLNLRRDDAWYPARSMTVPVDPPAVEGLGRTPGAIVLSRQGQDRDEMQEVSAIDGAPGAVLSDRVAELRNDRATHLAIGGPSPKAQSNFIFFDPMDQAQWGRITRAFKGDYVEPVDWSADRRRLIVLSVGPHYGAGYFYVDLKAGRAELIDDLYRGIAAADIAPVTVVHYKAGDGLDIPAYLTLPRGREAKGLPLVVLPHGGPGARDWPGFDWWAQALASRGYAVLQPQYRGSDGFDGTLFNAGYGQWGRKMQTDLSDGVAFLAAQGTVDPKRVCIVGGSYGGYAALAGVTLQSGVYRCAVSVNGPSDMAAQLHYVASRSARRDGLVMRSWKRLIGIDSLRDKTLQALSPASHADRDAVPILLIHGKDDTVVPFDQSRIMAAALKRAGKPAELVALPGEDHWLSRSDTRRRMLAETVRFLEVNNPPG